MTAGPAVATDGRKTGVGVAATAAGAASPRQIPQIAVDVASVRFMILSPDAELCVRGTEPRTHLTAFYENMP
ncbi:hypothetical protein GSI01S_01_01390 [Gordonia sihwensis NBRC 108236]|uniref:Uncharacterized protein n=2 Tax=Gordonia TaxID=2053 RepID=L7LEJ8_9ACTN|nr:hypothetical protein GSI01S_01_01390 [Gordonia sihwensis NBRC 108236]